MDQTTWQQLLGTFQNSFGAAHPAALLAAVAGRVDRPLVVLIHGIGGDGRHWGDPLAVDTGQTWLFDADAPAQPASTALGITQSPPYPAGSVASWGQTLTNAGCSYINWSQSSSSGGLDIAVQETVTLLTAVEQQILAQASAAGGTTPPLILLCHSRGGLIARAASKQLGRAGLPHLQKVITLATPHHGSYMPQLSADYGTTLQSFLDFSHLKDHIPSWLIPPQINQLLTTLTGNVSTMLLRTFGAPAVGAGFAELVPGSAMLQGLVANEQPLPGVAYYSFGGSNPTFIKFYLTVAGHLLPGIPTASAIIVDQLLHAIPTVTARYANLQEIDQGDSAVSLTSSQWPAAFAARHAVVHLNHMQALIDGPLQQAVLQIITS